MTTIILKIILIIFYVLLDTKFFTTTESWVWLKVILFWDSVVAIVNLLLESLSPFWNNLNETMFVEPLMVRELFFNSSAETRVWADDEVLNMKQITSKLIRLFITLRLIFFKIE